MATARAGKEEAQRATRLRLYFAASSQAYLVRRVEHVPLQRIVTIGGTSETEMLFVFRTRRSCFMT